MAPPVLHFGSMSSTQVLVVEPDRATATWLSQTLAQSGFTVSVAFDAASGHTVAASAPPDLVVVDAFLIHTGGVSFVAHLREKMATRPIGVLFMVPRDYVTHMLRERFFGLDDFVLKPMHAHELIERLHRLEYRIQNLGAVVVDLGKYTGRLREERTVRRELTIMFADVRGFTGMSESRDPENIAAATNHLLDHLAASVVRFGGAIDKFLGDGMMTVFGMDENSADHELAGVHAAQDIMDTLDDAPAASLFTGVDLALGIGVHSGDAVVGPVGPAFRRDVTAIGDTVNLASRICSEARPGEILVSQRTYEKVEGRVEVLDLRDTHLKGKRFAQRLYSVRLR